MRAGLRAVGLSLALMGATPAIVLAQAPGQLLVSGIRAYQQLEFAEAAGLLRRALAAPTPGLDTPNRSQALAYLGAAELFRNRPDSAVAVFTRLVRSDPRYRLDRLIFPPEVTTVFDAARRRTPAAALGFVPVRTIRSGQPDYPIDVFGSTYHDVRVEIAQADGRTLRTVYAGPVGDSLRLEWDGRGAEDEPLAEGRYVLRVTSLDSTGATGRTVRIPLDVRIAGVDTVPHPAPPADSVLLPERSAAGPALEALIGSLAIGTAIAVLPSALSSDVDLSPTRFAVGAAVTVAGFSGFFARRPGRPIPENMAANERVRADWRARVEGVARQNRDRMRRALLEVRAGTAQIIEAESP
ncbi:MAG: hypothetical protein OER21_16495 [Gemmatimonadota bacterium]|nr:hypothetical protein [Gemmatimonadota bacterium]